METEFTKKCRACLSDDPQMHYLFDEFDQGITLQDILISTSKFKVDKDDGFSPYICQSCTSIIVDFYNFIILYKENENQIRNILDDGEDQMAPTAVHILNDADEVNDTNYNDNEDSQNQIQIKLEAENFITIKVDPSGSDNEESSVDELQREAYVENMSTKTNEFSYSQQDAESFLLNAKNDLEQGYQINTYTCPKCGDCFLCKSGIKDHLISKHNISDINYNELCEISLVKVDGELCINKCKICHELFQDMEAYKEHLAKHKKNVCDVCGIGFVKKSYLKDHQEIHCSEKKHICNYCNKAFKRRTVLVKHKRIHTNPRECICEICGKAFNDKGTLKTHIMLLHIKTRNYVCLVCGVKFPLKATLDKHIRRHDKKEREYFCTQCPLGYKDKSSLDRHVYVKHSVPSVKPTCKDCGKQYTTASNLLKHQRSCHRGSRTPVTYQEREWISESGEDHEWVDEVVEEQ